MILLFNQGTGMGTPLDDSYIDPKQKLIKDSLSNSREEERSTLLL
jgi:hypothetical protein